MMKKDLNRHFIEEDIWMATKCMRRCSTPLGMRERQITTMMRYHHTPIRMAETGDTKTSADKNVGTGTLRHCCWESKVAQLLWKDPWWVLTTGWMVIGEREGHIGWRYHPRNYSPAKGEMPLSVERSGDHDWTVSKPDVTNKRDN